MQRRGQDVGLDIMMWLFLAWEERSEWVHRWGYDLLYLLAQLVHTHHDLHSLRRVIRWSTSVHDVTAIVKSSHKGLVFFLRVYTARLTIYWSVQPRLISSSTALQSSARTVFRVCLRKGVWLNWYRPESRLMESVSLLLATRVSWDKRSSPTTLKAPSRHASVKVYPHRSLEPP